MKNNSCPIKEEYEELREKINKLALKANQTQISESDIDKFLHGAVSGYDWADEFVTQ